MKRNDFLAGFLSYALWGALPLFWHVLEHVNFMVLLSSRIVLSAVFTLLLLAVTGGLDAFFAVLRSRRKMLYLAVAAAVISVNWGVYIWAVNAGHVMDASLGYYMNPLVVFACGLIVFHEKCGAMEWAALALASAGVLAATLRLGKFPFVAVTLALSFSAYGVLKKYAGVSGIVSIAVETLLLAPFALGFLLLSPGVRAAAPQWSVGTWLLLIMTGPATAVPMVLYTRGVTTLPFTVMGFLQYVSPTLMLFAGFLMGETIGDGQLLPFILIWLGLALFSAGMVRRERVQRRTAVTTGTTETAGSAVDSQ